jgi:magnesium transporter
MSDPQPGQVPGPGDMTPVTGWPSCPARVRLYRDGRLAEEELPLAEVPDRLAADGDVIIWIDLLQPSESDLERLARNLDLHPLAVEDALQSHQRTKLDRYRSHLFANLYAVTFDASDTRLEAEELSAFILPRVLVTVRKDPIDLAPVIARWDAAEPDIDMGHLVYGLLDALVDGQFDAAIQLSDMIQDFEDHIFDRAYREENKGRGFDLRKCLIQTRRFAAPMREVVGRFLRETPLVSPDLVPYFEDVQDHVVTITEAAGLGLDIVSSLLDSQANEQGNDLNDIAKKLASWAAVIAVPTAITGFYGQNLPFPGIGHYSGTITSITAMTVLTIGVYILLRRRHWL